MILPEGLQHVPSLIKKILLCLNIPPAPPAIMLSRWYQPPLQALTLLHLQKSVSSSPIKSAPVQHPSPILLPSCPHLSSCVHTGIPVSGVLLETQPQRDQVVKGETLVLVCSVAKGTGKTRFSWHREGTRESLGEKSQRSQRAELEMPVIRESHAGRYYCTADNGYGLIQSEAVNVTVRSK